MAALWNDDQQLFSLVRRELFTAVVGDVMDTLGLTRQFLPQQIRPLHPEMFTVGRAMTVLDVDWHQPHAAGDRTPLASKPFGLMFEALDDLKPGEIYLASGGSPNYALWGELMSMRAIKLGAVGAVLNGCSRDTKGVLALGFPTFSLGAFAQDQGPRGKVVDYRVSLEIDGVRIEDGDILVADIDGICVVPRAAEKEVFNLAIEKSRGEKLVMNAIQNGTSAVEAFSKFGIF